MTERPRIGDPVRVKFVELTGILVTEVWRSATVCAVTETGFGAAFADGTREMIPYHGQNWESLAPRQAQP